MVAASLPLSAQVKMTVRADGRKVIFNVPGGRGSAKSADLNWLAKQHDRPSDFDDLITRYSEQWRVDPVLVKAVIQVESNFDPLCVSNKGARGLMQLMPETAKRFGVAKVHDPEQNISGGVQYLAFLLNLFPNDLPLAIAAYNAGEGAVAHYRGIPPYDETQNYVQRTLTVYRGRPYGAVGFGSFGTGRKLTGGFMSATGNPLLLAAQANAPLGAFGSLR